MIETIVIVAIAAMGTSSVARTVRGSINDRRKARERALRGPEPVCGCGHHLSFHDASTGLCHAQVSVKVPNEGSDGTHKELVTCTCRRYVGPEPLGGYFAPEITA
jgi:hypothetical protein